MTIPIVDYAEEEDYTLTSHPKDGQERAHTI